MKDEIKEIINQLEIVARIHTIEVCEDGSKIETMSASVVDELRLNNYTAKILLDYITNLQEYKTTIEMEYEREYAKRYLEERRKEQPNLLYPDSDEIYKRYYKLKEENEKLKEKIGRLEDRLINRRTRIDKAIHRIQLFQMDGEVCIKDLGLIVRDLTGGDE